MPVDKQVTVALQATDDLTPALRLAARGAETLADKLDKLEGGAQRLGDGAGATRLGASLRSAAGDASRFERAMSKAGQVSGRAFNGAERGLKPLVSRLDAASEAADRMSAKYESMAAAGRGMLVAGGAMAVGIGAVVKQYAEFDSAMSQVQANTGATGATLDALRAKAIELGSATQYSGKEAAQGINELAKAGVSTDAILNGGLKGALALAAAGQMDVAEAAETAASAMTQFGLSGSDVPHIADLLAAGANKAQGSVHDMGMALNQVGLVAAATGANIDETVGTLTAFASAGMIGSDAGTSMKTMFQRLNPTTEEASKTMETLGLTAYDANGNFVGLATYAGRLQKAMAGLSPEARTAAMNVMFGADAVRAANILYLQGEQGIRQWTDAVKAAGFAQQNASALTNNLAGDWERFGGAIDGVVLKSGSGLNTFLRDVVQAGTAAVDTFGKIPAPILETGLAVGAVATAATLMGGAFLVAVPKIMAGKAALAEFTAGSSAAAASMSALGAAAAAVSVAFVADQLNEAASKAIVFDADSKALTQSLANLGRGAKDTSAFLDIMGQGVGIFHRSASDTTSALDRFGESARLAFAPSTWEKFDGITQSDNMGRLKGQVEQLDAAFAQMVQNGQIDEAQAAFDKLIASAQAAGGEEAANGLRAMFTQYTAAAQEAGDAANKLSREQEMAASNALGLSDAELKAADSAEVAAKLTDKFTDAIANLSNGMLSQRDSARGFEAAIDAASDALDKNGRTLDINTQKGRDNQAALDSVASSGLKAASDWLKAGGSIEGATVKVQATRDAFITAATSFGLGTDEAAALATQLGLTADGVVNLANQFGQVPSNVTTAVQLQGFQEATGQVDTFLGKVSTPPPPLGIRAPDTRLFAQGMDSALAKSRALDAQSPQVDVSAPGVVDTMSLLHKATTAAQQTDAQSPTVNTSAPGASAAASDLQGVTNRAKETDRQDPNVNVSVSGVGSANAQVDGLLGKLRSLVSRTWTGFVNWSQTTIPNANGGIWDSPTVRAYANGGMFERHVAQIAPAGAWRLWAEPETGGEAYIPLAKSKRARSTSILEEVARRFGMTLVKQANGGLLQQYASGGVTTTPGAASMQVGFNQSTKPLVSIPVEAKVTKVTIPKGVSAPFLYTPGGKWDTSTPRTRVDQSAIDKVFQAKWTSPEELSAAITKLRDANAAVGLPRNNYQATQISTSQMKLAGALKEAPAQYRSIIEDAARKFGVSANLIAAVIKQESGFNKNARSRAGAQGLMQLMPGTARSLGVKSPYDARQNVEGGTKYLADLLKQFGGSVEKALAAYNAGPGNVKKYGGIPPFKETQNYVKRILADAGVKGVGGSVSSSASSAAAAVSNAVSSKVVAEAKKAVGTWYKFGGGHGGNNVSKTLGKTLVDCSGLVNLALSKVLKTNVERDTRAWMRGDANTRFMSVTEALKTEGAVVVRNGHMALSVGDGKTVVEAPSTGKKVRVRTTKASEWTKGAIDTRLGTPGGANGPSASEINKRNEAYAEYVKLQQAAQIPARTLYAQATQQQTKASRQFLAYIRTIRDRGFPEVAYQLLMNGEDNGGFETAQSFAQGSDKELRNQRENFKQAQNYEELRKTLETQLGSSAGQAAYITATRQAAASNKDWSAFLTYVQRIRDRGYTTLASWILNMGPDEGLDVARTAASATDKDLRGMRYNMVELPDAIQKRQDAVTRSLNGPLFMQNMKDAAAKNAASATFLANIRKISSRGFNELAIRLLEMGEDQAGDMAAEAANAASKDLTQWQSSFTASEELAKQTSNLLDQLKGVGKVIDITAGLATKSDPLVSWDAPRQTAGMAMPSRYQYLPAGVAALTGGAPLMHVENVYATNPGQAVVDMETKLGDRVAIDGLRQMVV